VFAIKMANSFFYSFMLDGNARNFCNEDEREGREEREGVTHPAVTNLVGAIKKQQMHDVL